MPSKVFTTNAHIPTDPKLRRKPLEIWQQIESSTWPEALQRFCKTCHKCHHDIPDWDLWTILCRIWKSMKPLKPRFETLGFTSPPTSLHSRHGICTEGGTDPRATWKLQRAQGAHGASVPRAATPCLQQQATSLWLAPGQVGKSWQLKQWKRAGSFWNESGTCRISLCGRIRKLSACFSFKWETSCWTASPSKRRPNMKSGIMDLLCELHLESANVGSIRLHEKMEVASAGWTAHAWSFQEPFGFLKLRRCQIHDHAGVDHTPRVPLGGLLVGSRLVAKKMKSKAYLERHWAEAVGSPGCSVSLSTSICDTYPTFSTLHLPKYLLNHVETKLFVLLQAKSCKMWPWNSAGPWYHEGFWKKPTIDSIFQVGALCLHLTAKTSALTSRHVNNQKPQGPNSGASRMQIKTWFSTQQQNEQLLHTSTTIQNHTKPIDKQQESKKSNSFRAKAIWGASYQRPNCRIWRQKYVCWWTPRLTRRKGLRLLLNRLAPWFGHTWTSLYELMVEMWSGICVLCYGTCERTKPTLMAHSCDIMLMSLAEVR